MRTTYIGCIGTRTHCRQVTSLLCSNDLIIRNCILGFSVTYGSSYLNKKKNSGEQEKESIIRVRVG